MLSDPDGVGVGTKTRRNKGRVKILARQDHDRT